MPYYAMEAQQGFLAENYTNCSMTAKGGMDRFTLLAA